MPANSYRVKTGRWVLLLGTILLGGCGGEPDPSEASFRVIDAPANYVRGPSDPQETRTTTTTTTTVSSDAVTPGRTVDIAPKTREPQKRQSTVQTQPASASSPKSPATPAPRSVTAPATSYPTAKAVPDKPGYVFSPYDPNGGYVDVTGFSPGSKVKDPYSGKIFLVP